MGFTSAWHWIIVLLVVVIVFGAGKIPRVMGDVAKGIKSFKAGLKDDDDRRPWSPPPTTIRRSADRPAGGPPRPARHAAHCFLK